MNDTNAIQAYVIRGDVNVSRWNLVTEFMRLRKRIFIEQMGWKLIEADGLEFEQYDGFSSTYVIATQGDKVVGGARLLATTHVLGYPRPQYSYMIRDGYLGILEGLPIELYEEPPVTESCWELTRMATIGPRRIAREILIEANRYLDRIGVTHCLYLGPPSFVRYAHTLGWDAEAIGPVCGNESGAYQVVKSAVLTERLIGKPPENPSEDVNAPAIQVDSGKVE